MRAPGSRTSPLGGCSHGRQAGRARLALGSSLHGAAVGGAVRRGTRDRSLPDRVVPAAGRPRPLREVAQKGALEPLFRSQVRPYVEGLDVLTRVTGTGHLRGQPCLAPGHAADPAVAAGRVATSYRGRCRGGLLLRHLVARGRFGGALQHLPDRAPWRLDGRDAGPGPGRRVEPGRLPGGHPVPDGWLGRFRMGAAWLAVENQVPVIPVAHRGTFAAMPRGQGWPSPGRRPVTIRFGEPLDTCARTRRLATSRRVFVTAWRPCSTRTPRPGGRRGDGWPTAPPPTRPARRSPSGAGSGPSRRPPGWEARHLAVDRPGGVARCAVPSLVSSPSGAAGRRAGPAPRCTPHGGQARLSDRRAEVGSTS